MASTIVASTTVTVARAAVEYRDIHLAACRHRRQGLVCSTCAEVSERADRAIARVAVEQIAEAA
jgi:hypothetical protein